MTFEFYKNHEEEIRKFLENKFSEKISIDPDPLEESDGFCSYTFFWIRKAKTIQYKNLIITFKFYENKLFNMVTYPGNDPLLMDMNNFIKKLERDNKLKKLLNKNDYDI